MRKRNRLQVDTFPFLAVLLCAMGALILVLLVMDRRSKKVAQARAQDLLRQQAEEYEQKRAAHLRAHEEKKQHVYSEWEKKKTALEQRVSGEERALDEEMRQVQARLDEVARKLSQEEEGVRKLRGQLEQERDKLSAKERALEEARGEANALTGKLAEADRSRAQLAQDLIQLESLLRDMQKARKREAETYSVIPYHGKRGDNRRPIYLECHAGGWIFHPDNKALEGTTPAEVIRAEVRTRLNANKRGRSYLLLLVRPDGVRRYYELQKAVQDLGVEFGYELVDADWKFHFPESGDREGTKGVGLAGAPRGGGGTGAGAATGVGSGTGAGRASSSGTSSSGNGSAGGGTGNISGGIGLHPPKPYGSEATLGGGGSDSREGPIVSMHRPVTRLPGEENSSIPLPPLLPQDAGASGKGSGTESGGKSMPGEEEGPSLGPSLPGGEASGGTRKPVLLRPAQLHGTDEVVLYVECRTDGVIFHPGKKWIALEALNRTPPTNPLYRSVHEALTRQKALGRERSARVRIRFLVHPQAERTFHLAHPALQTISEEKTRTNLLPDDDVERIVSGF